jgi:hypothetical protein
MCIVKKTTSVEASDFFDFGCGFRTIHQGDCQIEQDDIGGFCLNSDDGF